MDIRVDFDGQWSISPDPCRITVNTQLYWLLRCGRSQISRLRWIVYFHSGTPFNLERYPAWKFHFPFNLPGHRPEKVNFTVTTLNTHMGTAASGSSMLARALEYLRIDPKEAGDHEGTIGPFVPTEPGTYKYGLRVEDAESGEPIGDDDPQLIVVRD